MLKLPNYLSKLHIAAILVPVTFAYSGFSYAALESQIKDVKLNEVTVFLRGAELFNSAEISLPAGESEVIFTNIASDINEKTLIIGTDSKVLIKSSQVSRNYLDDKKNTPEIEKLKSQMEEMQEARRQLQIEQQTIDAQLRMLEQNTRLGNDKESATIDDIRGMWSFIDTQMKEALIKKGQLTKEQIELDKKTNALQQQIQERQAKGLIPGNQLVVKFYSENSVNTNVHLSYAIQSANWVPTYDVSVEKINGPVEFTYKASVAQASGISWDNVHLKLSTGNLSQSAQAPKLAPNYLSLYDDRIYGGLGSVKYSMVAMQPPSEMMEYGNSVKESGKAKRTLNDYVVTNVSGVNTTFDISLPYSIPSDSKQHLVSIKEEKAEGDYRYFVVPKLSDNAFLQVQIADWQKLNLLPGKSNVFFEGSFIGEGYINVNDIDDELMNISLGRDSKIIVSRNNVYGMTNKPRFFGSNITQNFGYEIDIKNTRSKAIKLAVLDQIPVSRDTAINITDIKYDNKGELNKDTGELQWTLNMAANTAQKLTLSYTVKYPKNKTIAGL